MAKTHRSDDGIPKRKQFQRVFAAATTTDKTACTCARHTTYRALRTETTTLRACVRTYICKERLGINTKIKRSLRSRPERRYIS